MPLLGIESSPSRARIERILRDDLPMLLRFRRAAVFLTAPSGHPRLLTGIGDAAPTDGSMPNRLRAAAHVARDRQGPFLVNFHEDHLEGEGGAIVVPLVSAAVLVIYRDRQPWFEEEIFQAIAAGRLISRALGKS